MLSEKKREYLRRYYIQNAERLKAYALEYARRNRGKVNLAKRKWCAKNPEKRRATAKASALRRADKKKAYDAAWRSRNLPKLAAQAKVKYYKNVARSKEVAYSWRERNPGKHAATSKNWRLKYPGKRAAWAAANSSRLCEISNRRRITELRAIPRWADIEKMIAWYDARDAARELLEINVHVDHVIPLVSNRVCGLHCEQNMQLLPAVVNASKSNRAWPDMW